MKYVLDINRKCHEKTLRPDCKYSLILDILYSRYFASMDDFYVRLILDET